MPTYSLVVLAYNEESVIENLGVIGEYIADIHDEVKGRPLYVVSELENFAVVPYPPPRGVVVDRQHEPLRRWDALRHDRPRQPELRDDRPELHELEARVEPTTGR